MRKKLLCVIIAVIILLAPYFMVEINTVLFGDDTAELYKLTYMLEENNTQKVYRYSSHKAKVLYISDYTCDMLYLIKNEKNEWEIDHWDTIMSKSGSASRLIYPMYFPNKYFQDKTGDGTLS